MDYVTLIFKWLGLNQWLEAIFGILTLSTKGPTLDVANRAHF